MYLIGGHSTSAWTVYQDIWETSDGRSWAKVGEINDRLLGTTESRHGIWKESVVALNNEYFLLGGNLSTSLFGFSGILKSKNMLD